MITWKDAFKIGIAVGVFFLIAMSGFGWYIGKKIEGVTRGSRRERPIINVTCTTDSHYLVKIQTPNTDLLSQLNEASFFVDGKRVNCQKIEEKEPNTFTCRISESATKGLHTFAITSITFGSMRSVTCP